MEFEKIESKNLNFYAPRFKIIIDQKDILYEGAEITSVTVENKLTVPDSFSFTINNQDLKWLEAPLFQLGKEVEIQMGYGNKLTPMIIGEIEAIEPTFSATGPHQMGIRGFSLLKKLQRDDKIRSWENEPDFVIVGEIALEHGLIPDGIFPTFTIHPKVVQNCQTDFDFLKNRAEKNGFEFFVDLRTLFFRKPKQLKDAVTTLTLGKNLTRFSPEINVANKPTQVTVRGWDPAQKREIKATARSGEESDLESGQQSSSQYIENAHGTVERNIREPLHSQAEAEDRAQAILDAASDQFITGRGECVGIPEIRAGKYIGIEGLGRRFSMKYYIESATHKIDTSGYHTTFNVKGNAI